MRILRIAGRNLASLAGDFSVDFEQKPLASAGLFAITGPTGAGKSTLLDALCLALYDATPRLLKQTRGASVVPDVGSDTVSAQDPRTLLRRGCAEASAEVDFVGNDGQRYRARWSVRRSRSKSAGALQKTTMTLCQLPGLQALGGTNTEVLRETEQRIGMTFEQFTRAVLLAQNEFSAFLKSEENERGDLLEKLTGSDIYSALSMRAYERFKREETALRQLSARLADVAPMPAEERAALDAATIAAEQDLAALDQRKGLLEQQQRWHLELARLAQQLGLAEQDLAARAAKLAEAAERRAGLARIDAAQAARPLLAEHTRLRTEQHQVQEALEGATAALAGAGEQRTLASAALDACTVQITHAEGQQRDAAGPLNQAKGLDAVIATLAPAHRAAADALASANAQAAEAHAAQAAKAAELAATNSAHADSTTWLAQHAAWSALAAQWPRWDNLLGKACELAQQGPVLEQSLATARTALMDASDNDINAKAALAAASTRLTSLDAARQLASTALAKMDMDGLRADSAALGQRRDQAASAEKTWTALSTLRSRRQQALDSAAQLRARQDSATAFLARLAGEAPGVQAALVQAERSLKAAELACADSVATLRATLTDAEPCPVCGSASHPWHDQDSVLHAMLAGLQDEVARCRTVARDHLAADAAQRAIADACVSQLAALAAELEGMEAALAAEEQQWQAHPLACHIADAGWFAAELDALRDLTEALAVREQQAAAAGRARDQAQTDYDAGAAAHAQLQAAANQASTALLQAQTGLASASERHAQAASALGALLDELGTVMDLGPWHADPASYRAARAAEAQAWTSRFAQHDRLARLRATQEIELAAAARQSEQAARVAAGQQSAFASVDADIAAKRSARLALWEGRAVADVEAALADAVRTARSAQVQAQAAVEQAAHAETRAREVLALNTTRRGALQDSVAHAQSVLLAWLAAFPLAPIDGIPALAALLDIDAAWRDAERGSLAALDAAHASAGTVLAERRSQHALHAASAAGGDALAVDAALAALLAERATAHEHATALRLQLAQDRLRCEQASAALEQIAAQQLVERRWARLSELIGSPDGRKFRNYAQQFTLDVLLGYANGHLQQLARRYRLERVAGGNGPSLGLMVRDMDMGGEVRSVNSLSGGESFLVSLALALGLASLSSNRVRVESLFIDEGFGSLDHDTLQVAMDALDGLQSLGRKVGVISHVAEMTERIAVRIVVRPAGGGSSSVTVG